VTKRAPPQIRHAEVESCRANNPQLRHPQDFAISLQDQVAQVLSSPADRAIRPRLIQVGIVEEIEIRRPFRRRHAIHLDLPPRIQQRVQLGLSIHRGTLATHRKIRPQKQRIRCPRSGKSLRVCPRFSECSAFAASRLRARHSPTIHRLRRSRPWNGSPGRHSD
jgi:hypothetical protein